MKSLLQVKVHVLAIVLPVLPVLRLPPWREVTARKARTAVDEKTADRQRLSRGLSVRFLEPATCFRDRVGVRHPH